MTISVSDLALLKPRMLSAILRDERLGKIAARKENNRKQRQRLRNYIDDNRVPDAPLMPNA